MLWLRSYTSDIGLTKLLYISMEAGPGLSIANQFQCFVLTEMSSKDVIIIILENICIEITSEWYVDSIIKTEKTIGVYRSLAICGNVFCSNQITKESQKDVLLQNVQINNYSCTKRRKEKNSSLYRSHKLFLSNDWFEVIRVNCGIAIIPSFIIDVLLSSKSIQFGTKMTRTEPDNEVELREVLGPPHLSLG